METDFSFNNPAIKKYFEGDGTYVPTRELMYLHTHPLIKPNFIMEIDNLVIQAGNKLIAKNTPGNSKTVTGLQDLCIKLGTSMTDLDIKSAEEMLIHLRTLFVLCNKINRGN